MSGTKDSTADLRALEERLLDPKVRGSQSGLDDLLDDGFLEHGSSGHAFDKSTVMEAPRQEPGFDGPRTIDDFNTRELSQSIALVTYRIEESNTLRSSIWRLDGGRWTMAFHQGTRFRPD